MSINNNQTAPKKRGYALWSPERRSEIARRTAKAHPVRGFALMEKSRQEQAARRGGLHAHALRRAHEWNAQEAAAAGRLGGRRSAVTRRARAEAIERSIQDLLSEARIAQNPVSLQQAALRLMRRLEAKGIVLSFDRAAGRLRRRDHERLLLREQHCDEGNIRD